jgi:hypothetical protein
MIINDLDIVGIAIMPPETNTPLLVYSYTVLTGTTSFQSFKSVTRRNSQVFCALGVVNHPQFSPRNLLNIVR